MWDLKYNISTNHNDQQVFELRINEWFLIEIKYFFILKWFWI
jgi:hypothetical protein